MIETVFIRLTRYNGFGFPCGTRTSFAIFRSGTPTMIDNFAILFSTLAMLYLVFTALRLDRERPWFELKPDESPPAAEKSALDPVDPVWTAPRSRR